EIVRKIGCFRTILLTVVGPLGESSLEWSKRPQGERSIVRLVPMVSSIVISVPQEMNALSGSAFASARHKLPGPFASRCPSTGTNFSGRASRGLQIQTSVLETD